MTTRRPIRLTDLGRCVVCGGKVVWPSLHFCGPACSEAWVCKHREAEPVLVRKGKA